MSGMEQKAPRDQITPDKDRASTAKGTGPAMDMAIDISRTEPRHRREHWASFMDPYWKLSTPDVDDADLSLNFACRLTEDTMFSTILMTGGTFRSSKLHQDCILLRYQEEGDMFVRANDSEVILREGSLGIIDLSADLDYVTPRSRHCYLVVNRASLIAPGMELDPVRTLDRSTAIGRLVLANFFHVTGEARTSPDWDGNLVSLLSTLLRTALSGPKALETHTETSILEAKKVRAERYFLQHLRRERFDIDQVCAELGMSRATLYRLFQDDGGVRAYATRFKLDRLYRELEHTPAARGAVSRVSARYGFHDPSHFVRLFRRNFGTNPSDILGARVEGSEASRDATSSGGFSNPRAKGKFFEFLKGMRRQDFSGPRNGRRT